MSVQSVKEYLKKFNKDKDVKEFDVSSATVELAAKALNVKPERIAKTLSFKTPDEKCVLVVTAGDTKIDNKKFKEFFGFKAKMLSGEEVEKYTGFKIGGVCPFGTKDNVSVYCDESMQRFDSIFPACGSSNSAIELTCDELMEISNSVGWVDICKSY